MAISALIPVSEYLSTSYDPDCDYVDGQVQERNVGEEDHSDLQNQLIQLLRRPECRHGSAQTLKYAYRSHPRASVCRMYAFVAGRRLARESFGSRPSSASRCCLRKIAWREPAKGFGIT